MMSLTPDANLVQCWLCQFSGKVQGVGFRRHAEMYATELELLGWVRNLPDGTVEMLVQGTQADLERLLEKLGARFNRPLVTFHNMPDLQILDGFHITR